MWFEGWKKLFAAWLFIFLSLIIEGHSLRCVACEDPNCDSDVTEIECSTAYVLRTHQSLYDLNPSLEVVAPANGDFSCFKLNSSITVDYGFQVPVWEHGCTFRQTRFCEGWVDDVTLNACQVCETDVCNSISGNPTASPSATSTTSTTANPNNTGGANSKSHIGTKLVIGTTCLMFLFFS